MKTTTILLVLIASLGIASSAAAETDDAKAIGETVANYLEGWFSTDPERMSKALHPNLSKCTIKKVPMGPADYLEIMGATKLVAFAENNEEWVKGKKTHSMKIVYQDPRFAVVHAVSDDFYDICGLAKVNGEWKIVHVLWAMNEKEE